MIATELVMTTNVSDTATQKRAVKKECRLSPALRRVFVAMTSKLGVSCAAIIRLICASIALLREGQTERPRSVSYDSKSAGLFQMHLSPTETFIMDASSD